jgi:hypothetical protein
VVLALAAAEEDRVELVPSKLSAALSLLWEVPEALQEEHL